MKSILWVCMVLLLAGLQRGMGQVYDWTTIAGMAGVSNSTDGVGSDARFKNPYGLTIGNSGNIYVADTFNSLIRKLSLTGTNWSVSTIASVANAQGIAVDNAENIYLPTAGSVEKLTLVGTNWIRSRIAGGSYGSANGTNGAAQFAGPEGLAVDFIDGTIYVADTQNNTIRKVTPIGTNWVVTTIAGAAGIQGTNDGLGKNSRFNWPTGIALGTDGNLYVADKNNQTIRKLTPIETNWVVTTIAGQAGSLGSADGMNESARFSYPNGIAVDTNGVIFVAGSVSDTIRRITAIGTNWAVKTIGGSYLSAGSANGTNSSARFRSPYGVTIDAGGNLYVADTYNHTIRMGTPLPTGALQVLISPSDAVNAGAQWRVDNDSWQNSEATVSGLSEGGHTVTFNTISGWTTPDGQTASIISNQTTIATATYIQQFCSLQVNITPESAVNAGAQWQVDGGDWQNSGATVTGLTSGGHSVAFSFVPGWGAPDNQIAAVYYNQTTTIAADYFAPHPATATALMTNGFVVAVTITDAGIGYTNTPLVYLVGGGGTGAQATAIVSNGIVTGITIINAGSGYTNTPIVTIMPPFPLLLGMGIAPATGLVFTNLTVGANYQLQFSQADSWGNLGSPFVAEAGDFTQYFDEAINGSLYRLITWPIPYAATATPELAYGFVVAATVNDGGSGYVSVPAVQIIGGDGSGAHATATVSNGVVTAININNAGFGYTSLPTIQIDAPPVPILLPNVTRAFRLDYSGLTPALTYQLQTAPDLSGWTNCGASFTAPDYTSSQYINFGTNSQFFRLWLP